MQENVTLMNIKDLKHKDHYILMIPSSLQLHKCNLLIYQ